MKEHIGESVVQSSVGVVVDSTEKKLIRVLHVDDELSLLKVAKQCLEMQGPFQVDTANLVKEALAKLEKEHYDAVVSDYEMPGKDGLQFLKELRAKGNIIPFIIFTGRGKEEVAIKALNSGADGYFTKHGEPETVYGELAHGIRQVVDKRRAEQSFLKSEDKYRRLVEALREGIWVIDKDSCTTFVNPRIAEMLGYNIEEMKGRPLFSFMDERGVEIAKRLLERRQQGFKEQHNFEFLRKDGTRIYTTLETSPITDGNGNYIGALASVMNIAEKKRAEEELTRSEAKYRSLVEQSLEGIVVAEGPEPHLAFVNKAISEMYGYTPEEMTSLSPQETIGLIHPEDRGVFFSRFKDRLEGKRSPSHLEFRGIRKDGTAMWLEVSSHSIEFNGHPAVQATFVDITERKKAEDELKKSEEKYRSLFESANDVIMYLDKTGLIIDTNARVTDVFGYERNELIGKNAFASEFFGSGQLQKMVGLLKSVVDKNEVFDTTGEGANRMEVEIRHKKGHMLLVEASTRIIEDGNVKGFLTILRDITERKKSKESLRACGERFQQLFESQIVGVVISDPEGRISSANPTAAKTLGYSSSKELVGLVVADLFVDHKQRETLVEQSMNMTPVRDFEIALKRKDESRVRVRGNVMLYKDVQGDVLRTEWVFIEFSEHEKTEEELEDLKEEMDVLFEHAPDAYYLNDLTGKFVAGNKAAEEVTGYSKTELIGRSFLSLKLLPRSQILKAAKLLAINALGKPTGPDEFTLNRKDGTQVQVEIRTFPSKIKDQTLVLGIARDITERRKNEKLIIESQQKFEGLFTGNPEATVCLSRDFHILDANPRFINLFGYSLEEIKGKHIDDIIVPKKLVEEAKMLDKKAVDGYVYHDTIRAKKDESLVAVSISAAPILIQGQLAGYIGVYKDISELKKTEHQLAIINEKLRVVGGLTRHDVRNKLSTIAGNAYLLKKQLANDSKVLDKLRDMETVVSQVTRIFDFAKDYEMLGVEELTYIDVQKSVNEAVQLFSGLNGVKVLNECSGLTVLSDSLLRQLFYNLIDNSLKYGEKLSQIGIHYEKAEGNQLRLVYEDDGVGISQDAKPKLFSVGYTAGKGSGYGLYLIKRMMEVYGWTIQETGTPGKGAQFTMVIPEKNQNGERNYQLY